MGVVKRFEMEGIVLEGGQDDWDFYDVQDEDCGKGGANSTESSEEYHLTDHLKWFHGRRVRVTVELVEDEPEVKVKGFVGKAE